MRRFNVLAGTYLEVQTFEIKTADGKPLSSSKYEYVLKRKANGEEW